MTVYGDEKQLQAWRGHAGSMRDFLQAFVGQMKAPDYLALLPYFQRTPARHEALQALRGAFHNRHRVATTLGYGPRYLHSTGQLHKGGPNTGVFIMFTADASEDIPIPGQAYGFATLHRAQALGDFLTLAHKQRRVIRIHLGSDIEGGLKRIGEHRHSSVWNRIRPDVQASIMPRGRGERMTLEVTCTGMAKGAPPDPCVVVIFGASGDLARTR